MQRYESYLTRRMPIRLESCPSHHPNGTPYTVDEQKAWFLANQWKRLNAIRDLMRMEMPDAKSDIVNPPITFEWGSVPRPALHKLYASKLPTAHLDAAQCLYKVVAQGSPEAMEQFRQDEIGIIPGLDADKKPVLDASGKPVMVPVFVDGWGNPIMWLRWAPGYSNCPAIGRNGPSQIQSGVAENQDVDINANTGAASVIPSSVPGKKTIVADHDPFDVRKIDGFAFHLIPLIYSSAGRKNADGSPQYGIELGTGVFNGNPYQNTDLGMIIPGEGGKGNITNHHIESR